MRGLTLIGMPGVGKSTVGDILSKKLGFKFLDLDVYICNQADKKLVNIVRDIGEDEFLKLEERGALSLDLANTVFAPGGSIVYSQAVMDKLLKETMVFYLSLPLEELTKRLGNDIDQRGVIGFSKGLRAIYSERGLLYEQFTHEIIDCVGLDGQAIAAEIVEKYRLRA
ncbi:MAG: shikimate kinase [bacterium]|nr:shikimate kinase [bacterium]